MLHMTHMAMVSLKTIKKIIKNKLLKIKFKLNVEIARENVEI